MSSKSSPTFKSSTSSRLSRFNKRLSYFFSSSPPPPPTSPQHSRLASDNTAKPDVPNHADTRLLSEAASYPPSVSAGNSTHTRPSPSPQHLPHYLQDSAYQNRLSTHLVTPSGPYPFQGQASIFQGPSRSQDVFNGAHDFIVKDSMFVNHNAASDTFMEKLLQHTIIGAEFDSSDRDPPPRCHPGTRLSIIQRCFDFIEQCHDEGKLYWIVGPAGVGKSAVMQMVTEKVPDGVVFASIFLSVNGRRDGTKAILTIVYQLAVKCREYRQYIQEQISLDPSLLRKSLLVQFNKFIVNPFVLKPLFELSRRFLVAIDGLDECDNVLIQQNLLKLITDFCLTYPTSPIAWVVASRPEPHITSFFAKSEVIPVYTKEEMEIDSDEACEEVQRYLRDELKKIQLEHPTLRRKREWPLEHEFTSIASSAGGLFAYAATVIRYIGDPHYGDPVTQLHRVLEIIDASGNDRVAGREHPMARLDALYYRILTSIPDDVMINARKLLLACSSLGWGVTFREQCNMLGLTEDAAYSAVRHLHAVLKVPEPDNADSQSLSYFHKSFEDFLFDFKRSGFSYSIEVEQLSVHTSLRIVEEAPDNIDDVPGDKRGDCAAYGHLKGGCGYISLSWPGDERFKMTDEELRIQLYRNAMLRISHNFSAHGYFYRTISCFRVLTTRFASFEQLFPFYKLRASAFDEFREQLTELGKLKQLSLRRLDFTALRGSIELQFTSPIGIDAELSDPWNLSCEHLKQPVGTSRGVQGWSTTFCRLVQHDSDSEDDVVDTVPLADPSPKAFLGSHFDACDYCSQRLARRFVNNSDQLATIFIDSTQTCYIELSFVDPDDGVSKWRYRFFHSGPPMSIEA